MLRGMGLEISEIKEYMEHRSPARLDALLGEQQQWLKQEQAKIRRQLRIVENQRHLLELAKTVACGKVEELELPAARLVLSRNTRRQAAAEDWPMVEQMATEHERQVTELQLSAGLGVGAMVAARDFLQPGQEGILSHFFTIIHGPYRSVEREYRYERPAGTYLVTYFQGDYDDTAEAYRLLRQYIKENDCQVGAFSYEESILENMSLNDSSGFITRIAVQKI